MSRRLRDPKYLVSRWALQGNADDAMKRYNGTLVNTPTWGTFLKNNLQAIELDGNNQHVNVGDVPELNAVSAFTIAFWMAQDNLAAGDILFNKLDDGTHFLQIGSSAGNLTCHIRNGAAASGLFTSSSFFATAQWAHIAWVFDGSQAANIDRLKAIVNGSQVPLTFSGVIPATTADLSGIDATIGAPASSFDGKLHDMRIYNVPLTNDEILKLIHSPVPTY